jgi:hypothetical protein
MKKSPLNLLTVLLVLIISTCLLSSCDDSSSSSNNTNNDNNNNNNNFLSLTPDLIVEACLMRDACGVMNGGYIGPCVTAHYGSVEQQHTQPIWNELYRCVLQTEGVCSEIEKCFGNGAPPVSCEPSTEKGYCDGSVRYFCDNFDKTMYAMDCGPAGYDCVVGDDGNTACTESACSNETFEIDCVGSLLRVCDNGFINTSDCAVLGLECSRQEIEDGFQLFCLGDGGQCDPEEYTPTCDGNIKKTCDGGMEVSIDCTELPGDKKCEPPINVDAVSHCVPAGDECIEGDEYCLDSFVARICIDGTYYDKDCTTLGFTRCTGIGVNHDIGAHCTH